MKNRLRNNFSFLPLIVLPTLFGLSFFLQVKQVTPFPLCLFYEISHLPCPGCGLVRSFISISHGHFLEAIRFHALGPLVYLFFIFYFVRELLGLCGQKKISFPLNPGHFSYFLFAVLFWGQWILKLTPKIGHVTEKIFLMSS